MTAEMNTRRRTWVLTTRVAAATARMKSLKMKSEEAGIMTEVAGGTCEADAIMRALGYKERREVRYSKPIHAWWGAWTLVGVL